MGRARLKDRQLLCHYCNDRPGVTTDHVIPRAFSGPDAIWNYVPSCPTCNLDKGADWPTCPCDFCQNAIARFLSDPSKRMKAQRRLYEQSEQLASGLSSMSAKMAKMRVQKRRLDDLYEHIGSFRDGEVPAGKTLKLVFRSVGDAL